MFEYRVATKGILLSSTRKISESITYSGNQQLIDDYANWIDHKEQLTKLYAYSKQDLKEQAVNIDSLEANVNSMEKSFLKIQKSLPIFILQANKLQ